MTPTELPHDTAGDARRLDPADDRGRAFLRRVATRIGWRDDPVVRLQYLAEDDALVVDVLPLPPATDRVVDDLLCIEFDGADPEALPTAMCLTGFATRSHSPAARTARHLMGHTLWSAALQLAADGGGEREVRLDSAVRDARIRVWRRLTGLALGIEIQLDELRAALVGADGEIVAATRRPLPENEPAAVVAAITELVAEVRRERSTSIAGAPVVLGVQIGSPVHPDTGVVHYFNKRGRAGEPGWGWVDVELAELVAEATALSTCVLNDVIAFAAYERWVHPSPERCRAVLLIAQGIGAKLVINGDVAARMPMELGNIVLDPDGQPCHCGKRGCIEATAGTLAIIERVQQVTGRHVEDMQHAVDLAEAEGVAGDEQVIEVFRDAGRDLGRGIGIVQAIANPSSWAVYGPEPLLTKDSVAGDVFLASLDKFDEWVAYEPYRESNVRRRPISGDEGAHGAALAALERFDLARPDPPPADEQHPVHCPQSPADELG